MSVHELQDKTGSIVGVEKGAAKKDAKEIQDAR